MVIPQAPHFASPRPPPRKPVLRGERVSEGQAPSPYLCSPTRTSSCFLGQPGLRFRDAASLTALVRGGDPPGGAHPVVPQVLSIWSHLGPRPLVPQV